MQSLYRTGASFSFMWRDLIFAIYEAKEDRITTWDKSWKYDDPECPTFLRNRLMGKH
jgi:hypothetical protein